MRVQLPDGQRWLIENGAQYAVSGAVLTFTPPGGSALTSTFLSAAQAALALQQIDALDVGAEGLTPIGVSGIILQSIIPQPFAMHTQTVTVYGSGFNPNTVGSLYLTDSNAAPDLTGYRMMCTFVSSTQLIAQWSSDGTDSHTLATVNAFYQDRTGLYSNILGGVILKGVSSLTFNSITPNTGSVNAGYAGDLNGTGFILSGINMVKLDDGGGNVFYCQNVVFASDTDFEVATLTLVTAASTYTIYYSTDGGMTWTTTGLTVTIS